MSTPLRRPGPPSAPSVLVPVGLAAWAALLAMVLTWLTDVLAGYALGIAVVAAAAWVTAWQRLDWPRWDRLVLRDRAV